MTKDQLDFIEVTLVRIESKLDALLAALAEDEEGDPALTLDGEFAGSERDPLEPL